MAQTVMLHTPTRGCATDDDYWFAVHNALRTTSHFTTAPAHSLIHSLTHSLTPTLYILIAGIFTESFVFVSLMSAEWPHRGCAQRHKLLRDQYEFIPTHRRSSPHSLQSVLISSAKSTRGQSCFRLHHRLTSSILVFNNRRWLSPHVFCISFFLPYSNRFLQTQNQYQQTAPLFLTDWSERWNRLTHPSHRFSQTQSHTYTPTHVPASLRYVILRYSLNYFVYLLIVSFTESLSYSFLFLSFLFIIFLFSAKITVVFRLKRTFLRSFLSFHFLF